LPRQTRGNDFFGWANKSGERRLPGIAHLVPSYRYKFGDSYFVAAALSRVIAELGDRASVEIEMRAAQRVGGRHAPQEWAARCEV
jgi:hypothetical protein